MCNRWFKKTKTVRSSEAQPVVHVVSSREQDWTEQEVAVESSPTIIYQEVSGGESQSATSTIKALLELQQTSGEPSRHRKSCRCHRKRRGGGLPPVHMLIQQSSEELEKNSSTASASSEIQTQEVFASSVKLIFNTFLKLPKHEELLANSNYAFRARGFA